MTVNQPSIDVPINNLGKAVSALVDLNRSLHALNVSRSVYMSDFYVRDFGTVLIQSAPHSGKTYLAQLYATQPSTHLISLGQSPKDLLSAIDNLKNLSGISTVVVDCSLVSLLDFQRDFRVQELIAKCQNRFRSDFYSVLSVIAYLVQKAFGPNVLLIILG